MKLRKVIIAAALVAAPAASMPPPVPLEALVLASGDNATLRRDLIRLIDTMSKQGHFDASGITASTAAFDACWNSDRPSAACLLGALPAQAGVNAVTVVVDDPEWKMAAVRVRCFGQDIHRAREVQLYLSDALGDRPNALPERAKLAGCMIGALHGSPHDGLLSDNHAAE